MQVFLAVNWQAQYPKRTSDRKPNRETQRLAEDGTKRHRASADHLRAVVSDHPILAALILVLIFTAVFLAFPALDLWVSGLFFDERGFSLSKAAIPRTIRDIGYTLGILMVIWLILQLVLKLAQPSQPSYVRPSTTLYLLATLVAGPILLVNVFFKNNWGRPRPRDLDLFGGDLPFVGVWEITDHCYTNCSFVSGEASFAFWMVGFALIVPDRFRLRAAAILGIFAAILSFNRIAFGGHFLSDVVLSIALTLMVMAIGYRLFISHPPKWLANERLEAGLGRLGYWLQRRQPPQP